MRDGVVATIAANAGGGPGTGFGVWELKAHHILRPQVSVYALIVMQELKNIRRSMQNSQSQAGGAVGIGAEWNQAIHRANG